VSTAGTIRLTVAQAIVRYLQAQFADRDGEVRRFIPAVAAISGHGNVAGLREFRVRESLLAIQNHVQPGEGDYVRTDLATTARGPGASVLKADSATDLQQALAAAREIDGPVVIGVPVEKQRWLPEGGCWWDVAPAAVSSDGSVNELRREYVRGLDAEQRFYTPSTAANTTYA
jgi:TPP-dependent trihydroxycyclohexane-1,2-dione (THcHDO) dehydratase